MLGFRRNLSTQDVMLQLKHQIVNDTSSSTKAIFGLDLKKAFDNVEHAAILDRVRSLGLGLRTYNYVRDFPTGRRASVVVGNEESPEFETGPAGTPQGSVVSTMLFNLVLFGLPAKRAEIEGLHHSLYADDITLWVPEGRCDGHVETTLQAGVDAVQEYLRGTGLEFLAEIRVVMADGVPIPRVNQVRVLGLHLQSNGHNAEKKSVDC
ncbi:reverse transcriptase, putative [Ixodes scapularis]|uniref:Reverse transcriptase, putative n=1 Tax=Ixodes scapularis TaxID=6945 RepID=B7PS32_IXOSC|nr:reverse transcriptase, putative [Ixodes scapularis]|eukprot:XP_002401831.1 reverse transcriptase, putative [Ixodes scapularis]